MKAYYNEIEPSAVLWLQAAMDAGIIAAGDIDTRPIQEVKADDIRGYNQAHFFSGIGGWSIALRMAGWGDDRPVWTGSCPCQPFSSAGKQKGKADDRHLWPVWFRLIRESRPPIVFGEQVPAAIRHGWWDDVADDMEGTGYSARAEIRPACSVGKAHKRDRLWFVAESELQRLECQQNERSAGVLSAVDATPEPWESVGAHGASTVANRSGEGLEEWRREPSIEYGEEQRPERLCEDGSDVADPSVPRLEGHRGYERQHGAEGRQDALGYAGEADIQWLSCPDGKARPIIPGLHLLVDGLPGRLRKAALHGYGNAIVPQVAAEFIKAYMETL